MAAILVGEEPYSRDPTVSEWSNPLRKEERIVKATARLR